MRSVVAGILLTLSSACVTMNAAVLEPGAIDGLKPGMTKAEVFSRMNAVFVAKPYEAGSVWAYAGTRYALGRGFYDGKAIVVIFDENDRIASVTLEAVTFQ